MQVPVKDAVHQRAFEEPDHAGAHDGLGVDSGRAHAADVGEPEPLQSLHHEHAARHQRRVGSRDHEVALAERGERHGDVEHVLGLESEVELFGDRLGEQLDERRRVGERRHRDPPDQVRGEPGHHGQVLCDAPGHLRSLHLHDDGRPVDEARRVYLRDRRRGHRDLLNRGEHLADRAPELLGQDPLDHRPGLGRHLVAAPLELGDELGREDALARGHDLAQLDVGRPQPLGRHPQPARDPGH